MLVPQIRYALVVATLLRLMDAVKIFDVIFMLTRGGPGRSTEDATFTIYRWGLQNFDTGHAAAFSWILVILLSILVAVFVRRVNRRYDLI